MLRLAAEPRLTSESERLPRRQCLIYCNRLYPTSAFSDFNLYSDDASTFKIPGPALYKFDGASAPAPAPKEEPKEEAPAPAPKEEAPAAPAPAPEQKKATAPVAKVETEVKPAQVVEAGAQDNAKEEAPLDYCTEEEEDALDQAEMEEMSKAPEPASSTISVPARHRKTARPSSSTEAKESKPTRKYEIVDHQDVSSAQAGQSSRILLPAGTYTFLQALSFARYLFFWPLLCTGFCERVWAISVFLSE